MQDWLEFEKLEPFGFPAQNLIQALHRHAIACSVGIDQKLDDLFIEFKSKSKSKAKVKGLTVDQWRLILMPPKESNV